ncbi:T-lymphocyte activation antigen CD86 isoform X2 [Apodemus sylvaticus]|nr:T-lymphocyte activation antigen CD86 isoform X2 [Apodemus sylvaticus]XP_052014059.1 T-lymphocyte activation antigen CD86 isoform X2 [Apodemus sylvaticus]
MDWAILFVTIFVLSDAVPMKRQAYSNGTAYLPCPSTKAQNMSLNELVVFWQDQQNLVLYEHFLGTEKLDNVNAKYLGRTSFDGDNWTLRLHNVQIKDMGSYTCFIQKKTPTGSIILQQTLTELSVIANFSEPEIELSQNVTRNSPINLTCSSKDGYPKPTKMYFLITNSTNERGDNMQISQDNVTELFSVSIRLFLRFPDGVFNMTVVCILETESMNISSKPYNLVPESQFVRENQIQSVASISVMCCSVLLLFVFLVAKKCCKKQNQPGRPRGTTYTLEQDGSADRKSINLKELEPQITSAKPNAE